MQFSRQTLKSFLLVSGILWMVSGIGYLSSLALLKDLDLPLRDKAPLHIQNEIKQEREDTARSASIAGFAFKFGFPILFVTTAIMFYRTGRPRE